MTDTLIEAVSKTLCRSGKFETGEGTCAPICMEFFGDPRKSGCGHARRVHEKLARAAILATLEGIKEPTDAMKDAGEDGQCEPDFDEAGRVWQAMLTSLIDELKGDL